MTRMRFGVDIAQQRMEWDDLLGRVRLCEDLGFDGMWGFDHLVTMYGEGPGNCFEGMTTLAALASATTRIRLGLLVTGVTYRHPSVLAAQAVTVDHASHGRLELAMGAAWYEAEHHQLGIDFPPLVERFDRLEDCLEILTRLLTGEVVDYQGRVFSLAGAQLRPTPVQQPHPPLWIGGSGRRRTLPLVARYADVWHCYESPQNFRELSAAVDELATAAGRDPASITRASSLSLSEPWSEVRANAEAMGAAGVGYLVCGWPGEGAARVEEFVAEVLPDFAG
jgi:F420-dependent oxidoreductase-like protein